MTERWEYGEDEELTPDPGFPWPPPEEGPILTAFAATWKGSTFDPGRFFAETPRDKGTGAAIVYYLAIGILVGAATLFWEMVPLFGGMVEDPWAGEMGYPSMHPLVRFLLVPAVLLLGLFIWGAVVHVLLMIFDGATHGFGTTVRVICYAYSPALFGVVPVLGTIVGGIWSLVLLIIGLREAHEAAAWKPVVAVLIPFLGMLFVFLMAMMAVFMAAGSALPAG